MALNGLRDLQQLGRRINGVDPGDFNLKDTPPRVCFVVVSERKNFGQDAFTDAVKAARMFIRADFRVYFLENPEYPDFYAWMTFFLDAVSEYLSIVITGFPMSSPDGGPGEGHPFVIKKKEICPTRVFKIVKEFKREGSRVTFVINGCPAVESWSNEGMASQKLSFSVSSSTKLKAGVRQLNGNVGDRVLVLTTAPRLDDDVDDRMKSGASCFITELSKATKADPVKTAAEIVAVLGPKLRTHGEEIVAYASSEDVDTETPLLL